MKALTRLSAALLAVVAALVLAVPAFAAQEGDLKGGSITIGNAVKGQEYSAYQIMYLESYDATSGAYSYKANSTWADWLKTQAAYVSIDDQGYVTWKSGASEADFARAALEHAKTSNIAADAHSAADSTTVKFTDLKLGYYLVDSSLGTLCSLDTTNPDVTIKEKNAAPTNEKQVQENSTGDYGSTNDASIGDVVSYQSTITAQKGAENYVFHDTMSAGLTYGKVTGITLNGATVDDSNYTVVAEGLTDGCTFEVRFTQAFCDMLKANDKIVISYTATVNEKAVIAGAGNPNKSKLSYGDKDKTTTTPPSETKTYVWDVDVLKYTMEDTTEKPLEGAVFTLSRSSDGSNALALVSEGGTVYRVAQTGEAGSITSITTDATGAFTIKGLDSGTYYLTETAAPAGYNKLAGPVAVVIGPNGTTTVDNAAVDQVKVENHSGSMLPSTGGIGTIVLYAIGAVLVIGAIAGIVALKRRNAQHR